MSEAYINMEKEKQRTEERRMDHCREYYALKEDDDNRELARAEKNRDLPEGGQASRGWCIWI